MILCNKIRNTVITFPMSWKRTFASTVVVETCKVYISSVLRLRELCTGCQQVRDKFCHGTVQKISNTLVNATENLKYLRILSCTKSSANVNKNWKVWVGQEVSKHGPPAIFGHPGNPSATLGRISRESTVLKSNIVFKMERALRLCTLVRVLGFN